MARSDFPMGKGILAFLPALEEDELERITSRAREGRAAEKFRGVRFGPKPSLTEHQKQVARKGLAFGESYRKITKDMGVAHITPLRLRRKSINGIILGKLAGRKNAFIESREL